MLKENDRWKVDTLSNRLTVARILLIPFIVTLLSLVPLKVTWPIPLSPLLFSVAAAILFIVAGLTDLFDGYIARRRKQETIFGAFLDPMADKLLIISSLIILESLDRIHPILVIILVSREVYVIGLRLLAIEKKYYIHSDRFGKLKTISQMSAIPCLMIYEYGGFFPFSLVGTLLIIIATILSIFSSFHYTRQFFIKLKRDQCTKEE